jgi:hypothetical protein
LEILSSELLIIDIRTAKIISASQVQLAMNEMKPDPEICPDCGSRMQLFIVFSSFSRAVISHIKKDYSLKNGYFRLKTPP